MMKTAHDGQPIDIAREPITHEAKVCILTAVYSRPGSRLIRRNGHLWIKSGRFEVLAERLCPTSSCT